MKKIIPLLLVFAFFACQNIEQESYTLTGKLDNQTTGMVYLQDRVSGQMIPLDSASIENGTFTLEGTMDYPQMYYLQIEGVPGRLSIFMENSDIDLTITQREPLVYEVTGSESHDIYQELNQLVEPYEEKLRSLQKEVINAEIAGDTPTADQLREKIAQTEELQKAEVKRFISLHNDKSVAVFIATRQLMHGAGPDELREIFALFDPSLKGTRYYDEMEISVLTMERVANGKPAVDFTLDNPQGEKVSLSDLRGNVVLISFWASWCPYCRESNPELVKVYEKYGDDKFEVLGVSLDRNHEAWVKGIEEDGLQWIHVSDLKGWQSDPAAEYAVRSIPQNVLVGADGTILGRNLKYYELDEKLEDLLSEM